MNKEHVWFLVTCILILLVFYIFGIKLHAKEIDLVPMDATAYCDYGTTASGEQVRVGICAMRKDLIGKTAIVYSQENGVVNGLIGIYEIKDTGGHELIKTGKCVDIYMFDSGECFQFGRQKVLVQIVDAKGWLNMYEIVAYHCDYCKRYYTTKGNAKRHEKECFYNPQNKACLTCGKFITDYNTVYVPPHGDENYGDADYDVRYNYCEEDGKIFDLSIKNGKSFQADCKYWIPK